MGLRGSRGEVAVIGPYEDFVGIPEYHYFERLNSGEDMSGMLPMPEGVTRWHSALYRNGEVLFADSRDGDVYFIANDERKGLALFHFVDANENGDSFEYYPVLPWRSLQNRKEKNSMNPNLAALAGQAGQVRGMSPMPPMNLQGTGGYGTAPYAGDGISSTGSDQTNVKATARARGYVFGYVVKNAPVINSKLRPIRDKEKGVTGHQIDFVQTKPSGLVSVLIAVPTRCISHNGNITTVENIDQGNVDFSTIDPKEMTYMALDEGGAIGMIQALGSRLPEYRPNVVPGYDSQWSVEEIQASGDVSFVEPRIGKSASKRAINGYVIHLKSTRGMLFAQGNIMCLRALEHLKAPKVIGQQVTGNGTKSAQDEYLMNESAFGMWRFRNVRENGRDTGKTTLQVALAECPTQIWETSYTNVKPNMAKDTPVIEKVDDGIGSCFFAQATAPGQNEKGEARGFCPGYYYPWWQLPKEKSPVQLDMLAFRQVTETKDGKGRRAATSPVLWKDNENHPMFAPYARFADAVVSMGFLSRKDLQNMGSRTSRKGAGGKKKDPNAERALRAYLQSNEVVDAIERVRKMNADKNARAAI